MTQAATAPTAPAANWATPFHQQDWPTLHALLAGDAVPLPERAHAAVKAGLAALNAGQRPWARKFFEIARPHVEGERLLYSTAWLSSLYADTGEFEAAKPQGELALRIGDQTQQAFAPRKKVVAFSLYGGKPEYCEMAVLNAEFMPSVYPGWEMVVYHDHTVPAHTLNRLTKHGARLVTVQQANASHMPGTFWRFLALEDLSCERVIFRDADSLISEREKVLVDIWQDSGKPFHVIRDWYGQTDLILAGLWGAEAGLLAGIRQMIDAYLADTPNLHPTHADQRFLARFIWPRIKNHMLHHSSIFDGLGATWPKRLPRINRDEKGDIYALGCWILSEYQFDVPMSDFFLCIYEGPTLLAQYQYKKGQIVELPRIYRQRFESGRYHYKVLPFSISITPTAG